MLTPTVILIVLALLAATTATAARPHPNPRVDTAQRLNRALAGTPMHGLGWILEAEGRRAGVHPAFIAAVAGVESSFGAAHCTQNTYWVFGLGSCARSWTPPYFTSWRQAIRYQARFLHDRWIAKGARDPWTIGRTYCPPCGNRWGDKIAHFMGRLGFPAAVTYRKGAA